MPAKGFKCRQCGNCCLFLDAYCTTVDEDDILMWEEAGREDIIDWVETIETDNGRFINEIWISPRTREDVKRCPWLRKLPGKDKYICRIQALKPRHCREYPLSRKHAKYTNCPGFSL